MPLDEAHRSLEVLGFNEFDDLDAFGDDSPLLDSNWAVLAQIPAPGIEASIGGTIQLKVGKIDDQRTLA